MKIKFIQVNIYRGKYLENLIKFLKRQNADIISAQEVTVGKINLCSDKNLNVFKFLEEQLELEGVYHNDIRYKNAPGTRFGNAVFSKFPIKSENVLTLKEFRDLSYDEIEGKAAFEIRPKLPRHLLDASLDISGQLVHAISWHGAWTAPPQDTEETLRQAKMVCVYIKNIDGPFVMGGDLNNIPQSKTVELVNKVVNNLMIGQNIVQTTHPIHHKISPRGFLVDYIFSSDHFKLQSLEVPEVLVSDHLPVVAQLEL